MRRPRKFGDRDRERDWDRDSDRLLDRDLLLLYDRSERVREDVRDGGVRDLEREDDRD